MNAYNHNYDAIYFSLLSNHILLIHYDIVIALTYILIYLFALCWRSETRVILVYWFSRIADIASTQRRVTRVNPRHNAEIAASRL